MKKKQEKLSEIGTVNADKHHLSSTNRRKEFWSAVDSSYLQDLLKIFEMDFKMFRY